MRRYILCWITHWKFKKNSSLVYHVIIRSNDGDLVAKFPTLSLSQAATLFDERRRFSCEIPYPVSHRQPPCLTIVTHERNTMKWNVLQLRIKHQMKSFSRKISKIPQSVAWPRFITQCFERNENIPSTFKGFIFGWERALNTFPRLFRFYSSV